MPDVKNIGRPALSAAGLMIPEKRFKIFVLLAFYFILLISSVVRVGESIRKFYHCS